MELVFFQREMAGSAPAGLHFWGKEVRGYGQWEMALRGEVSSHPSRLCFSDGEVHLPEDSSTSAAPPMDARFTFGGSYVSGSVPDTKESEVVPAVQIPAGYGERYRGSMAGHQGMANGGAGSSSGSGHSCYGGTSRRGVSPVNPRVVVCDSMSPVPRARSCINSHGVR